MRKANVSIILALLLIAYTTFVIAQEVPKAGEAASLEEEEKEDETIELNTMRAKREGWLPWD